MCVVGAGLVGLSVAHALVERHPGLAVLVVDKEDRVAAHQSGHNSGVVHSGLYYLPGSLKARLCVSGRMSIAEWCADGGVPYRTIGKLVIATRSEEVPALDELERRGRANGLGGLTRLGPEGIREIEPAAAGIAALHVPEAGIVDYPALAARIAERVRRAGGEIATGCAVTGIDHRGGGVVVHLGPDRAVAAGVVVNCAGLHSDRVAALAGITPSVGIVPFRGEYYTLREPLAGSIRALVYPVPDPRFPFLGVHFTPRVDGSVEVGPNAVLAWGREQYRGVPTDWSDLRATLGQRGFRRLARRHWRSGAREILTSRSRRLYARLARRLVPAVAHSDLAPGGSGVRAQAVAADGALVDDFVIERAGATVHVLNAPSPGATASLAIGRHVADMITPDIGRIART